MPGCVAQCTSTPLASASAIVVGEREDDGRGVGEGLGGGLEATLSRAVGSQLHSDAHCPGPGALPVAGQAGSTSMAMAGSTLPQDGSTVLSGLGATASVVPGSSTSTSCLVPGSPGSTAASKTSTDLLSAGTGSTTPGSTPAPASKGLLTARSPNAPSPALTPAPPLLSPMTKPTHTRLRSPPQPLPMAMPTTAKATLTLSLAHGTSASASSSFVPFPGSSTDDEWGSCPPPKPSPVPRPRVRTGHVQTPRVPGVKAVVSKPKAKPKPRAGLPKPKSQPRPVEVQPQPTSPSNAAIAPADLRLLSSLERAISVRLLSLTLLSSSASSHHSHSSRRRHGPTHSVTGDILAALESESEDGRTTNAAECDDELSELDTQDALLASRLRAVLAKHGWRSASPAPPPLPTQRRAVSPPRGTGIGVPPVPTPAKVLLSGFGGTCSTATAVAFPSSDVDSDVCQCPTSLAFPCPPSNSTPILPPSSPPSPSVSFDPSSLLAAPRPPGRVSSPPLPVPRRSRSSSAGRPMEMCAVVASLMLRHSSGPTSYVPGAPRRGARRAPNSKLRASWRQEECEEDVRSEDDDVVVYLNFSSSRRAVGL